LLKRIFLLIIGGILIAIGTILAIVNSNLIVGFLYGGLALLCVVFIISAIAGAFSGRIVGMVVFFILTGLLLGGMIFLAFATHSPVSILSTLLLLLGYILIICGGILISNMYEPLE